MATKLDDYVGYHLRRASILDLNDLARTFGDGMKPVPFTVLCLIDETPGITAADIGRALRLQRANLAPMLAEFDERGLIERHAAPEDSRIQRLHLSGLGARALKEWRAQVEAHEARILAPLSNDERAALRQLLMRIWRREPKRKTS